MNMKGFLLLSNALKTQEFQSNCLHC